MSFDPSPEARPQLPDPDNGLLDALNAPVLSKLGTASVEIHSQTLASSHNSSDARRFAARRLGDSGSSAAVPALSHALIHDPVSAVRAECAVALGRLACAEGVPALIEGLGDRTSYPLPGAPHTLATVAEHSAEALVKHGALLAPFVRSLFPHLDFASRTTQSWLYLAIAHVSPLPKASIRHIRAEALSSPNPEERARLVAALELSQGTEAATHFIGIIKGWFSSQTDREQACSCLGYFKNDAARQKIYPVLRARAQKFMENRNDDPYGEYEKGIPGLRALTALEELGTVQAQRELVALLGSQHSALDYQACTSIAELHKRGLKAEGLLFDVLDSKPLSTERAYSVVTTLGLLDSPLAIPKLLPLLEGAFASRSAGNVLNAACVAIGKHARHMNMASFDQLRVLARSKNEFTREAALDSIGRVPQFTGRAFQELVLAIEHTAPLRVTQTACDVLVKAHCVKAIPHLEAVAEDPMRGPFTSIAVKRALTELRKLIPGSPPSEEQT